MKNIKEQVWDQVEIQVCTVWEQLENRGRNQVAHQVWDQVGDQL